ncbi:MAG: urea ABC transporter permease subunit UrtB [Vicinamibacterales bacterium]
MSRGGLPSVARWLAAAFIVLVSAAVPAAAQQPAAEEVRAILGALDGASFLDKEELANRLIATGHPSVSTILGAWLEDRLYTKADGQVMIVVSADDGLDAFEVIDPLTLTAAGAIPPADLIRIGTNNRLRRFLRTAAARFSFSSPDADVRLAAVQQMMRSLDSTVVELLQQRAAEETDSDVRYEIDTALAIAALDGDDVSARRAAVDTLSSRLGANARNRLAALLERSADGTYVEPDEALRTAAAAAVTRIDGRRRVYEGIETLFFGMSLGSVLVLVAIGLAITFGVMGVINMAHGELMMLGAYTTYVVQLWMPDHIGASVLVAVPAAFLVSGLVGIVIERVIIRFLYGRPLETLLATFGVSLILQQAVRSIFSANNRAVETPAWMSGTWQVNGALGITYNRLYIVFFTVAVFALLMAVLKRTRVGLNIRAVSQNRAMARAMGVRSEWVDALTFGLGSGIAGVAGVALSQLTNVGPNLGQAYIIDSFMVVVFGGVGNLWGTLLGGMSLGVVNKVLEPYSGAVLGKILVLVGLILFIQRRPRGLFPQTGRAAESA